MIVYGFKTSTAVKIKLILYFLKNKKIIKILTYRSPKKHPYIVEACKILITNHQQRRMVNIPLKIETSKNF